MPDAQVRRDLAEVMVGVARRLGFAGSLDERLQHGLDAAVDTVPGVDQARARQDHAARRSGGVSAGR